MTESVSSDDAAADGDVMYRDLAAFTLSVLFPADDAQPLHRRLHRRHHVGSLHRPHLGIRSRVVSVLDSGAEGPGFKSQPRRCRVTVLGRLFTPIVPLFSKQRNW